MFICLQNHTRSPLRCGLMREQTILLPPAGSIRLYVDDLLPSFTVWHTYGSHLNEQDLHIVLDSTFTFSDLQEGDTVELYREKIAVDNNQMPGYVWYDRVFAWCRVAAHPSEQHSVAEEAIIRQAIVRQYRRDRRWDMLVESLLDVWIDLALELGGGLLLFVLLWIAYGFAKAVLIALAIVLGAILLTIGVNWLMYTADHRKKLRRLLSWLTQDTITAYYATPLRAPVDGKVENN